MENGILHKRQASTMFIKYQVRIFDINKEESQEMDERKCLFNMHTAQVYDSLAIHMHNFRVGLA